MFDDSEMERGGYRGPAPEQDGGLDERLGTCMGLGLDAPRYGFGGDSIAE